MDQQLAAYLLFTTLLVLTPGAATAVVVRNVLDGGRRSGMAAAAGAAAGNSTYALLSALGLAAVFARVPAAFLVLRVGGAIYLAWLGAKSLWAAWRPVDFAYRRPPVFPGALERGGAGGAGTRAGFSQGLVNNLVNPAVAMFYLAVVPSFLNGPPALTPRYLLFAIIHVTMAFAYHTGWVWALHALRTFWSKPAARRTLETLTGVALLVLAAKVAGAF